MPHIDKTKARRRLWNRTKLKELNNITINIGLSTEAPEEIEEKEEVTITDDLEELLMELNNIKTKRTLTRWVAENKQWINELTADDKQELLNTIQKKFFPGD